MMEGSADLRIVLLGKTGAGKSSVGNSILGQKLFRTSSEANSDTSQCEAKTDTVDGRSITVIDTPGFCSTDCFDENSDKKLKDEILKCIIECSPGPHAFLIVLPVRRQTAEEQKVVEEILKMFGKETLKYSVVLFTHGKQLEGMTIQQFVEKSKHLKKLVKECGNRLHVVDNTEWNIHAEGHSDERSNAVQIKKLLKTIDQMVKQNGGEHYTNEMLKAISEVILEDVAQGRNLETAKHRVLEWLLIKALGIATGALLGAFLGAVCGSPAINALMNAITSASSTTPKGLQAKAVFTAACAAVGAKIGAEVAEDATTPKEAIIKTIDEVINRAAEAKAIMSKINDNIK